MAQYTLHCGNCLDILPQYENGSITHVVTDPPYSQSMLDKIAGHNGLIPSWAGVPTVGAADGLYVEAVAQFKRLATRWMLNFTDVEFIQAWKQAYGASYYRTGIWLKPSLPGAMNGKSGPGQACEAIVIAHAERRQRYWNAAGHRALWIHNHLTEAWGDERYGHPCPKPLPLMLELVEQFTLPGELVLDPFMGTGTTGVACLRLGRRFLGIECNEEFYRVAKDRLEAESHGQPYAEYVAGQLPLFAD